MSAIVYLDLADLRVQFRNHLYRNAAGFDEIIDAGRFAAPNRPFVPPGPEVLWVRESLIVAEEQKNATQMIQSTGFLQYEVLAGKDEGSEEAEALQRQVAIALKPGTDVQLTEGPWATVDRSERLTPREWDDKWYSYPVSTLWRVHTPTT